MENHKINIWKAKRAGGIGGSDIGAIMGLDKYRTPLQVYYDKTGQSSDETNKFMEAGHIFERFVGEWFADENGLEYIHTRKPALAKLGKKPADCVYLPDKKLVINKDDKIFLASQDYNYSATKVLECKSTLNQTEEVEASWFAQGQWYLGVTGKKQLAVAWVTLPFGFNYDEFLATEWNDIKVLRSVLKYHQTIFGADDNFIHKAQIQAMRFWADHVVKRIPPEPINDDDIKLLYPRATADKQVEAVDETYNEWQELCDVMDKKKEIEGREKTLKFNLKAVLKDAELITYGEKVLATFKTINSKRVSNPRLKEDGLYEKYLAESSYRKLDIKR